MHTYQKEWRMVTNIDKHDAGSKDQEDCDEVFCVALQTSNSAAKTDESLTDHMDSKMSRKDNKDTDLPSDA